MITSRQQATNKDACIQRVIGLEPTHLYSEPAKMRESNHQISARTSSLVALRLKNALHVSQVKTPKLYAEALSPQTQQDLLAPSRSQPGAPPGKLSQEELVGTSSVVCVSQSDPCRGTWGSSRISSSHSSSTCVCPSSTSIAWGEETHKQSTWRSGK